MSAATSSRVSSAAPARSRAAASVASKRCSSTSSTTEPYICRKRRHASHARRSLPVARANASTVSGVSPRLSTVCIMPGIDTGAPERTDTSSGSSSPAPARPNRRFVRCSSDSIDARTSAASCSPRPAAVSPESHALCASVETMKPGGTGSPIRDISHRSAPLPPSRSFIVVSPSAIPAPNA
jgi:hypothetical protein